MSNAANTVDLDLDPSVTALIAEVFALLVEIEGEDKGTRYNRIRRLSERLEGARGRWNPWDLESKALGDAVGRVFRFRSWGR